MKRVIRKITIALAIVLSVVATANLPSSIRVGVGGQYRVIRMPLYVKWTQFIARHYEYERLAKEIAAGCRTDEEKVMAILTWTRKHIKDQTQDIPVYDDHILYILIRGYGVPEQFQDVFTTLCVYSGFPAFYAKPYDKDHKTRYTLSFVRLNGQWRVFDAYYGVFFRNEKGEIACIDDIAGDPSIVSGAEGIGRTLYGVPYREYFADLKSVAVPKTLRAEWQMPLHRIVFEGKKALKLLRATDVVSQ